MKKQNAEPCYELLEKLLKNIIENAQTESEEGAKYRSVKKQNKKLSQFVTKLRQGVDLMDLIGFSL